MKAGTEEQVKSNLGFRAAEAAAFDTGIGVK
jgi:hypothetical protein